MEIKGTVSREEAAQAFAAIGSEPRLDVLSVLVRAGAMGLTAGEIMERLGIPGSTLSHHLRFLQAAHLIEQEKVGRNIINRAAFDYIQALAGYLLSECCVDEVPGRVRKKTADNA